MPINFNPNTLKTGREIAGDIKSQVDRHRAVPTMELMQAKAILGSLQQMNSAGPAEREALTGVINTLQTAISQGEAQSTPSGGTGRVPGRR